MKKVYFLAALLFVVFIGSAESSVKFKWALHSQRDRLDGFRIYYGTESLTCQNFLDVSGGDSTTATIEDERISDLSWGFFNITAIGDGSFDENESGKSREILAKFCSPGVACQSDFTVTSDGLSITATWDDIPGVGSYQLRYSKPGMDEVVLDNIVDHYAMFDLPEEGDYTFELYARGSTGLLIDTNNTFTNQSLSVSSTPPPTMPNVAAWANDLSLSAESATIMLGIEWTDPSIEHFRVNVHSASANWGNTYGGDIVADAVVPYGTNFCQIVHFGKDQQIFFFNIVPVDYDGREGEASMVYVLPGDIMNIDVDFQSAEVSGLDYQKFRQLFNLYGMNQYSVRSTDFCNESNLYDLLLTITPEECADANGDGYINSPDRGVFQNLTYGNSGAGK